MCITKKVHVLLNCYTNNYLYQCTGIEIYEGKTDSPLVHSLVSIMYKYESDFYLVHSISCFEVIFLGIIW